MNDISLIVLLHVRIIDKEVFYMKCNLSTLMGKNRCCIEDVHKGTGLSRSTITELYHDRATRIDYSTVEKLCLFFKIDIADLFSLENVGENK